MRRQGLGRGSILLLGMRYSGGMIMPLLPPAGSWRALRRARGCTGSALLQRRHLPGCQALLSRS